MNNGTCSPLAPLLAFLLLATWPDGRAMAQLDCSYLNGLRTCIIEPIPQPGHIESVISGDTTSSGERVDRYTTYVLRRGGTYPYQAQIRNSWPLRVEAEEGDGPRPVILPVGSPGTETPRLFRTVGGDLHIKGLRFLGFDNFGVYTDNATVRVAADDVTVVIEDCVIENQRLGFLRTDNRGTVLKVINSIIWNNYQQDAIWKGWGVRSNGQPQDTIMIVNNVFVNSAAHTNWGIWQNNHGYINWSHNTFINVGMTLDEAMKDGDVEFGVVQLAKANVGIAENNLFYNAAYMGDNARPGKVFLVAHDSLRSDDDEPYLPSSITIRNNYLYLDPTVRDAWGDSISAAPFLEPWLAELAASKNPNYVIEDAFVENVSPFVEAPTEIAALVGHISEWYSTDDPGITIRLSDVPASEELDVKYDDQSAAKTGSTDGLPVGALFPWGISLPTPSENDRPELRVIPSAFALRGNYPNPFNPSTLVRFALTESAKVGVVVFDVNGRVVKEVAPRTFPAGRAHEVRIEATGLGSGTYVYRVTADLGTDVIVKTGRMTLVK